MMANGITVAFDCSGTLVDYNDEPRPNVVALARAFQAIGMRVVIWTGGGIHYGHNVARLCGLGDIEVMEKTLRLKPNIAVDDEDVSYGSVNIRV